MFKRGDGWNRYLCGVYESSGVRGSNEEILVPFMMLTLLIGSAIIGYYTGTHLEYLYMQVKKGIDRAVQRLRRRTNSVEEIPRVVLKVGDLSSSAQPLSDGLVVEGV